MESHFCSRATIVSGETDARSEDNATDFKAFFRCDTDVASLVPQMLEAFIRSDKAFMKRHAASIREQAARAPSPLPSVVQRSPNNP